MQDKGRYKKENEAMTNTGKKRITKEKVEENRKPKMFQDMGSAGKPISKPVIIERLSKNGLPGEHTVEQVVNRLKYERKQHRAKK